jgi:hypothetical protein
MSLTLFTLLPYYYMLLISMMHCTISTMVDATLITFQQPQSPTIWYKESNATITWTYAGTGKSSLPFVFPLVLFSNPSERHIMLIVVADLFKSLANELASYPVFYLCDDRSSAKCTILTQLLPATVNSSRTSVIGSLFPFSFFVLLFNFGHWGILDVIEIVPSFNPFTCTGFCVVPTGESYIMGTHYSLPFLWKELIVSSIWCR